MTWPQPSNPTFTRSFPLAELVRGYGHFLARMSPSFCTISAEPAILCCATRGIGLLPSRATTSSSFAVKPTKAPWKTSSRALVRTVCFLSRHPKIQPQRLLSPPRCWCVEIPTRSSDPSRPIMSSPTNVDSGTRCTRPSRRRSPDTLSRSGSARPNRRPLSATSNPDLH